MIHCDAGHDVPPNRHKRVRSAAAIRARMLQISWRTTVAHQSPEDTAGRAVTAGPRSARVKGCPGC
jgi:hypothetical protein